MARQSFKPGGDAIAALIAAAVSGSVFLLNAAPTVTFGISGEVTTAAFTLGVPHPPGHPVWTMLGFLWSRVLLPFGDPAWRLSVLSSVTGAAIVGVMALTTIRCIGVLLRSLPWDASTDARLPHWIARAVGINMALLFGFSRPVWTWACAPDVQALSLLLIVLTAFTVLSWVAQPERRGYLRAAALLLGLGLAEVRGISVLAIPAGFSALAVGVARLAAAPSAKAGPARALGTAMAAMAPFWELLAAGLVYTATLTAAGEWLSGMAPADLYRLYGLSHPLVVYSACLALLVGVGWPMGWLSLRHTAAYAGLLLAGVAACLYIPLAASSNPPVNWGCAVSPEAFRHVLSRGSYEPWHEAMFYTAAWPKIVSFSRALVDQYAPLLSLAGLTTLILVAPGWVRLKAGGRALLAVAWSAFLAVSLHEAAGFQSQYRERLSASIGPALAFQTILIGLGLAAMLGLVARRGARGSRLAVRVCCAALCALPLLAYARNRPHCALGDNDFGLRFARLVFEPGGGYAPMERGAILFAGTDDARFLATYMIFCESRLSPRNRHGAAPFDRSDVYLIAQNALADQSYLRWIRAQYDLSRPGNSNALGRLLGRDRAYPKVAIGLPDGEAINEAFRQYVEQVRESSSKTNTASTSLWPEVNGVMAINGILARRVFEENRDRHPFYVEESYVIPWMYPHLRPAGTIMKLERAPLPGPSENPALWQGIEARDRAYWDSLSGDLLARDAFRRNPDARRAFSRLRCALAGIYAFRGLEAQAELAFRQAVSLCPELPEASLRLAELYGRSRRYAEARAVLDSCRQLNPDNERFTEFRAVIGGWEAGTVPMN